MMNESMTRDVSASIFKRRGAVAACTVLMVVNQFAPLALAEDIPCHVRADFNCDQVIDGQDLGFVLSNWGTRTPAIDLDGDCEVGGGDLTMILASWGALPDIPELEPIQMEDEVVKICLGDSEIVGTISSDLQVNPDLPVFEGWATGAIGKDVVGSMTFSNGSVLVTVGSTKVVIDGDVESDDVLVNNKPVEIEMFLRDFRIDVAQNGLDVDRWDETSQAVAVLALMHHAEPYSRAIFSQQAQPAAPGFWCKSACIVAAAAIVVLAAAGCAVLIGGCVPGSIVTIGGLAIPCAFLIGLCAGGVFIAGGLSYHALLIFWNN